MSKTSTDMDLLSVNTIRMLAVDQVERAKSGHPGLPLGAAPMAYVLWQKFLRHNPLNPNWVGRDRFVLSAGHGSALLYALLHLTGYELSLDELKNFRQWGSKTPGHPEHGLTPGVESTTGPLGQGFANAVGMAMAECVIANKFNRKGFAVADHYTYVLASDGDLMEGISSEAASLAGHLKLGKLVCLYDNNHISIEGDTAQAFTEDVCKRFEAYGWCVSKVEDGNDLDAIETAIEAARNNKNKPSLISVRTHIGFGSPKQDTGAVHGEPLGADALAATKKFYNWPQAPSFFIPDDALKNLRQAIEKGRDEENKWRRMFDDYKNEYPSEAETFENWLCGNVQTGFGERIPKFKPEKSMATRDASGEVMNAFAIEVGNFIGGSADLSPSTKTTLVGFGDMLAGGDAERNIHFGVREHAMGGITNGMALHGGIIPFCSTFLIFSDYMRSAIRLASLMKTHSIFIFTHDSVGLGEDGPTHQPVEHIMSLRAIPNLTVFRPADANETAMAWRLVIQRKGPAALLLTRQKVNVLDVHKYPVEEGVKRGAYVLRDCGGKTDVMLIATGSEVHLALAAAEKLEKMGIMARVVSMPSWELFDEQTKAYRDDVLPPEIKTRIAIEAGATLGWHRFVGDKGMVIGLDHFGASAPGDVVMEKFEFSVDAIVQKIVSSQAH